jgi:type IV pilus assembly protein PilY1
MKQKLSHKNNVSRSFLVSIIAAITTVGYSSVALPAPGELSGLPLSLVTSTKPNILLLLDDSGSMDGQNVITTAAQDAHNDVIDGQGQGENRTAIETDRSLWRLCAGYNALAFNPKIKYEKWRDFEGNTFDDQQSDNISGTVLENPLDAEGGVDLSDHIYIRWDDEEGSGTLGVYDSFSSSDGECGPGVAGYDLQAANPTEMPTTGQLNSLPGEKAGILSDSNANEARPGEYTKLEDGVFFINIPDDGDPDTDDFITFEITSFNTERGKDPITSVRDSDSLTISGGAPGVPVNDAVTVTELFDGSGGVINVSGVTYSNSLGETHPKVSSALVLNDDNDKNRAGEVRTFTVSGNSATLAFDGGTNNSGRQGFILTWRHSSFNGEFGDGVVTKLDCNEQDEDHHCVRVDSLPLTEAEAIAQGKEPYNTQENYANWYTYYRKRDYVAKKALGDLVFDSDYRIGFATINDNGDGGAIVKDMESTVDGVVSEDKNNLLEKIYRTRTATDKPLSDIGTPLIKGLSNAGRYFLEGVSPDSSFLGTTTGGDAISAEHLEGNTVSVNSPVLNNANGGQCQQNFTLIFSDGAWGDNVNLYAGTDHDVNGAASGFMGNVDAISSGDKDNTGDGDGDLNVSGNDGDLLSNIYADELPNTLADVAMYYFLNDLAPSATDSLSLNLHGKSISHQHMVTFAVGFGVDGDVERNPNVGATPADIGLWPDSVATSNNRIDDLRHAAFNSRGDYLSASNVQELQQSLDDIITEIGVRLDNTAAGASFSAFELIDGEFRYDTTYNNVIWWGDMESFAFNQTTQTFDEQRTWSVDEEMRLRGVNRHIASDPNGRKIITYNGIRGVPFSFPNNYPVVDVNTELSDIQLSDLLTNAPHLSLIGEPDNLGGNASRNKAYGDVLVDYLRGSGEYDGKSLDGTTVNGVIFDSEVDNSELHLFRNREEHYIGALIHSEPRFVGAPNAYYPDSIEPDSPYSDFVTNSIHKNRRTMLYVGGNDGMLHGFYAKDESELNQDGGEEVFAYIPQLVSDPVYGGQGLNALALSGSDGFDGAPYVDGSPVVADVYVDRDNVGDTSEDDSYELAQWRSYLVGGLRAGARGIYVLDVTNPDSGSVTISHPRLSDAENVAHQIVVKEFTHPDLGYIYGKPSIGKMNNGRWAAIVGNGYNSSSTGDGTASLFIIYLDASTEVVGDDDTDGDGIKNDGFGDYSILQASANTWLHCANEGEECLLPETSQVRYSLADGTYRSQSMTQSFVCDVATLSDLGGDRVCEYSDNNGLSQPRAIDIDRNGTIDRVYAGDLHGNMWIFDVAENGVSAGSDAHRTGAASWGLHVANQPFYTTCSSGLQNGVCPRANRQPITSTPLITNNPLHVNGSTEPNHIVFFGTGQYLTDLDEADTSSQSFYAIWDAGTDSFGLDKSNLTPRRIINETVDGTINGVQTGRRTIKSATVNYSQSATPNPLYGWYYESLPDSKERVVLDPLLFGNTLLFQTLIPTQGTCNATAGSGYIMAVDALTGGNPSIDLFGESDGKNVAGIKVSSVIVGSSITKTDKGTKINVKTADGNITSQSLSQSIGDIDNAGAGNLYRHKGRKSWSILR